MNLILKVFNYYSLGRFAAITIKPLLIYIFTNYVGIEEGNSIAKIFVFTTLTLVFLNTEVYRKFYFNFFNSKNYFFSFSGFLVGTLTITLTGFLIVFLFYKFYLVSSFEGSLWIALFFVSEKLADESLRFKLFEKNFINWGILQLIKSCIILSISCLFYYIGILNQPSLIILMTITNLLVFYKFIPFNYLLKIFNSKRTIKIFLKRGLKYNYNHKQYLLLAIFSTSVSYIDRLLGLSLSPEKIAIIILLINSFSIMVMVFDFYYFSLKRQEFVTAKISLRGAFLSLEIWKIIAAGSFISFIACFFVLNTTTGNNLITIEDVLGIYIFELVISISLIPYQILYWNNKVSWLLKLDLLIWTTLILLIIAMRHIYADAEILLAALLMLVRFGILILKVTQLSPKIKKEN